MSSPIGMTRTALGVFTMLTTICGSTAVLAQGVGVTSGSSPPAASAGTAAGEAAKGTAAGEAAKGAAAGEAAKGAAAGEAAKKDKPSAADVKQAKRDLADANKLIKKGQCEEALPKLDSAYSVDPKPAVLRSIAQCHRDLKHNVLAFEAYEKLINLPPKQLTGKDRAAVDQALAELRAETGTIRVSTATLGAEIKIDQKSIPADRVGQPIRVEPGKHKVSGTASGFEPFESEVPVEAAKEAILELQFRPEIKTGHVKISEAHGTSGVHVLVDGKDVGVAPWEGDLDPGQHTVALTGPNLTSEPQTVGVAAKADLDVLIAAIATAPPPPVMGKFQITTTPSDALVSIDGKPAAGAAGELEAGTHQVQVSAPGFVPVTRDFVVSADKPAIETIELERDVPTLRVGAMVGLVSLPRPIKAEVMLKLYDVVGLGGEFSMIPEVTFPGKDAKMELNAIQGVLRWFPFRGAFYLGAGLGVQNFKAHLNSSSNGQEIAVSTDMSAPFISPQIGWIWTFRSGFTLGLNAGVQIPFANDPIIDTRIGGIKLADAPEGSAKSQAQDNENQVHDIAKLISNTPLPNIDLLKIGFFF